jgi:hypothetical protein
VEHSAAVDVHMGTRQGLTGVQLDPHVGGGQPRPAVRPLGHRDALTRVHHRELRRVQPREEQLVDGARRVERRRGHVPHRTHVGRDADPEAEDPRLHHRDRARHPGLRHLVPELGRAGVGADREDRDAVLVHPAGERQQPVPVEEYGLLGPGARVAQRVLAGRLGEA